MIIFFAEKIREKNYNFSFEFLKGTMKTVLLCLTLFTTLFANPSIVEERHQLFILGVLSYLHRTQDIEPKPGWDIAALIAWDVENVDQTPEFVIDRNRNFEKQGNIFHAEIMTIEKAVAKKRLPVDLTKTAEQLHKEVGYRLANANLYSTLEPCPFCTLGISHSRIKNVIYFMQDPTARDKDTYAPLSLPQEFCGRKLTSTQSSTHPLALQTNQELRNLMARKEIDFARYFLERQKELAKEAHEIFIHYEVVHEQNRDLYNNLINGLYDNLESVNE